MESEERDIASDTESECPSGLLDEVDSKVPTEFREVLRDLLRWFAKMFSNGENVFGRANAARHRIDTGSNRPFRQALRRHPTMMVEVIDSQVDAILKADLKEPAQSQ